MLFSALCQFSEEPRSSGFGRKWWQVARVKVILFRASGKYYTEEMWRIPTEVPVMEPINHEGQMRAPIGPYDMIHSPDFRRIDGGAVLIESQEPWGFPHLFPSEVSK